MRRRLPGQRGRRAVEADEDRARAALGEGFCPDCLRPLAPREGEHVFGWCETGCRGYWVDGDLGLQVTKTAMSGWKLHITKCEHWRDGVRRRIM